MDSDYVTCSDQSHEDEDIISGFPDEILRHIRSYLPSKDLLKTLALSTRWKSLRSLSILYFDFQAYYDSIRHKSSYINLNGSLQHGSINRGLGCLGISDGISLDSFHDMVQALPDCSRIAKFRFHCPMLPNNKNKLQSLLSHAARHKIEDVDFDFDFWDDDPYEAVMSLPRSLTTSDSLTSLKLTMATDVVFEFPTSIWLPSLRTLYVEWFQDWEKLILPGCCPVLEELILRCTRRNDIDISIASATIRKLTIECFFLSEDSLISLEVNCSNTQYLNLTYWPGCGDIQVCDLHILAEADINLDCQNYLRKSPLAWRVTSPPIPKLLENIRHVKSLQLSSSTVQALQLLLCRKEIEVDKLPIFYNLTHLRLGLGHGRGGNILLMNFLQKSPHLQSLSECSGSYLYYYEDMGNYCLKDVVVPSCLEYSLKTFSISSGGTKEEIDFLRYILENAKVLEHFTIHWCDFYGERMSAEEKMSVQHDLSTLVCSDCSCDFS